MASSAPQLPGVDDFKISLTGIATLGLAGGVVLTLLLEPGKLAAFPQFGHHLLVERHQVEHIRCRIFELTIGERTGQPVGSRLIFFQLDPEEFVNQRAKTDRDAVTEEGGGQLGVVHLVGQVARLMLNKLQIFARGVQDGDLPFPAQSLPQGGEIQRQRIQQRQMLAVIDLEQAKLGIVSAGANEFSIDSQGNVGQRSEIVLKVGLLSDKLILHLCLRG